MGTKEKADTDTISVVLAKPCGDKFVFRFKRKRFDELILIMGRMAGDANSCFTMKDGMRVVDNVQDKYF